MRKPTRFLETVLLLTTAAQLAGAVAQAEPIDATRATYLTRCGGCHGIEGVSARNAVPDLRDQAGIFLCSAEGRDYMLRVPNVAMSMIADDARLAAVMNFVVFQMAGASTPPNTAPFTASEIHTARTQPLRSTDLTGLRRAIYARALRSCHTH